MKKGIIVIEPKTPRLNYLRTELPFILIYGKPLIHHHIENLIDAEVFDIVIVIPNTLEKDLRGQLGEFFQERAKIKVSIYLGENYFLALKNILANTEADDHHIIFTGLISEKKYGDHRLPCSLEYFLKPENNSRPSRCLLLFWLFPEKIHRVGRADLFPAYWELQLQCQTPRRQ